MNLDHLIKMASQLREMADSLENEVRHYRDTQPPRSVSAGSHEWIRFDPTRDAPPWTPNPHDPAVDRRGKDLCLVVTFGQLYALNLREGRGATRDEVRDFAIAGGYNDGRGISAWRGTAIEYDDFGHTWLTAKGHDERLLLPASTQKLELPEYLLRWNGGLGTQKGHSK